jgi:hypothetical protein
MEPYFATMALSALAGTVSSVIAVTVTPTTGGSTRLCGKPTAKPDTASTQTVGPVDAKEYRARAGEGTVKLPLLSVRREMSGAPLVGAYEPCRGPAPVCRSSLGWRAMYFDLQR